MQGQQRLVSNVGLRSDALREASSSAGNTTGNNLVDGSPEQKVRAKGGGRSRVVDDHRADREKKGKYFDFSRKVANFETGCVETKEVKQGVAGDLRFLKDFATPRAVGKVFDGVLSLIAKGAGNAIMTDISASVSHSPAGWPAIEESFDIDTMSRRFHLSTKVC